MSTGPTADSLQPGTATRWRPGWPAPGGGPGRGTGYGVLVLCVLGLTVVTFAVNLAVALQRYHRFRVGSYDLVIFDQAVRGYAHLSAPISMVKGVHNEFGPHFSVLGDHFSPVLALLAPLYWVWNDPRMLLAAQALLFALAVPVVWVYTRRVLGVGVAFGVAAGFGLGVPLLSASTVGFHEVAFAVPLIAVMLERAQIRKYHHAVLAALVLLLVKEDMGLVVAAFGVLLMVRGTGRGVRRGVRRGGAALVVGGLLASWVAVNAVIPHFGGRADYYWNYDLLGPDPPSALRFVLRHPLEALQVAVTPVPKVETVLRLVVPSGMLCLFSPVALLALPLLAERLLSSNPNVWTHGHHYDAFLAPVLTLAAVEAAGRLSRARWPARFGLAQWWPARFGLVWAGLFCFLTALMSAGSLLQLADPDAWATTDRDRAAAEAASTIPDGALVEAVNEVGPHLTARSRVLLLDRTPRGADWVVADTLHRRFPFLSVDEQQQRVRVLSERGYRVVYQREGFVVLHRGRA